MTTINRRSAILLSGSALVLPANAQELDAATNKIAIAENAPLPATTFAGLPRETILAIKASDEPSVYSRPHRERAYIWRHMHEFLTTARLTRLDGVDPAPLTPLAAASAEEVARMAAFRTPPTWWAKTESQTGRGGRTLDEVLADPAYGLSGLLVLKGGRIVYEAYPRMLPTDLHNLMSVTKAFVGTLVALLVDRGEIDVSRPIEAYIPDLAGSVWEGTPIIDILDMTSGIDATEENFETDPTVKYRWYEESIGYIRTDPPTTRSTYEVMRIFPRLESPGQSYVYSSVNTFVLAWLVETITGLPFDRVLTRELWSKMGAGSDGTLVLSALGAPSADGGISMTLRDLARFGLLFTSTGRKMAGPVVPPEHVTEIQKGPRASLRTSDPWYVENSPGYLGSHWQYDDIWDDGDFQKDGLGGQVLYVSPGKDVVIAVFAMTPDDSEVIGRLLTRAIAQHLA